MRKLTLLFLFVVLLAFDVVGCAPGPSATATPETPVVPEPSATATPEVPVVPEPSATATPEVPVVPEPSATATPEMPVAPSPLPEKGDQAMAFEITSAAFAHGENIPARFTCDGDDVSPALQWTDPPQGTQSFALICDDPDAPMGTWVHWVLYNLPGDARALPEAFPSDAELPDGSRHGQNSGERSGYGGPCPPSGTHRYFFKLYALDTVLDLKTGSSKEQLLSAMEGHILAQAELMGLYARR